MHNTFVYADRVIMGENDVFKLDDVLKAVWFLYKLNKILNNQFDTSYKLPSSFVSSFKSISSLSSSYVSTAVAPANIDRSRSVSARKLIGIAGLETS